MKQKRAVFVACCIVSISSLFFSCASTPCFKFNSKHQTNSKLEKASWLIGELHHQSKNAQSLEIWTRVNDRLFSATSLIVKGKDTLSKEYIQLIQMQNKVFYIPIVDGQNGGKPVFLKPWHSIKKACFPKQNTRFPTRNKV
jgi:hypothetical protein